MPKKCYSKCRKLPLDECNSKKKCYYLDGKTRK